MDPFKVHKELLLKYVKREHIPFLQQAWNEPHRKYHNIEHLNEVISYIDRNKFRILPIQYDTLILAAFFHDAYYNPRDTKNNEDESIKRFLASYNYSDLKIRNEVVSMIESTKYRKQPIDFFIKMFWDADNAGFYRGFKNLLENEKKIKQEFSHVPLNIYKKNRIEFLKTNINLFDREVNKDIDKLIEYVSNY